MKILYIGPIDMHELARNVGCSNSFPDARYFYPFGAHLLSEFHKRGHEIVVLTQGKSDELVMAKTPRCVVYAMPQRKARYQMPTLYCKEIKEAVEIIKREKPDIVFPQWSYYNTRMAIKSGFPYLGVVRDSPWKIAKIGGKFYYWYLAFYAQLLVFPFAKHLSTISQTMFADIREICRYHGSLTVIPNAMSEASSCWLKKIKVLRVDAKNIFCITNGNKGKNTITLLRAFNLLQKKHLDWTLTLIGRTTGINERYSHLCDKLSIDKSRIIFCGTLRQDEILKRMHDEADAFVSASLEESFGMTFVEAMSVGVPCVGGNASGAVPWVLDYGKAGALANVRSSEELSDVIERVMLDYDVRLKYQKHAYNYIQEQFSMRRIADQYISKFEEIISGGRCD